MLKRIAGLVVSILLPLVFLIALFKASTGVGSPFSATIVISEVAWGGTAASSSDEWIELYNVGNTIVSLDGWLLQDSSGTLHVTLSGDIEANGFYLLERTDDQTISDVPADLLYTGALHNSGEQLTLSDKDGAVVDTVNADGGNWPAGSGSPSYLSMERVHPEAADTGDSWADHDGLTRASRDADGNLVSGTPRQPNSTWSARVEEVDLKVTKTGPPSVTVGHYLQYQLVISNAGTGTATGVRLTDTLPSGLVYVADDSGVPLSQPAANVLVWEVGALPGSSQFYFHLIVAVAPTRTGTLVNTVTVGAPLSETETSNNQAVATTKVVFDDVAVVIDAVFYDGYEAQDVDEAVRLRNVRSVPVNLAAWQLSDGSQTAHLPDPLELEPGGIVWLAADGVAFQRQFGFAPDVILESWPGFANVGDEVILREPDGTVVDVLVYEGGNVLVPGWSGEAVQPYHAGGLFAEEGQILFRRRVQESGLPVPDSNTVQDWAQSTVDVINGRKVQYPGWALDRFFFADVVRTSATITIAIAPDNAYEAVVHQLQAAQSTIQLQTLTFENLGIADALIAAAQRGVDVTVLLEGDPVGGIADQERYICQKIENAGGECWFMIRDDTANVHDRYRFLHAKFAIIDERYAVVGSENFSPRSLPYDDKEDGTWGRRGVILITDALFIVERLVDVFADDFDAAAHQDLLRWTPAHPIYGKPAPGFAPITKTGGTTYTVRYPYVEAYTGDYAFNLLQAPENSLRDIDGLLGLLKQAGQGDTILVQQLTERPHWGSSNSNSTLDPNPRLESYINAARRGASVQLLLDRFFDEPTSPMSNAATCHYVNEVAMQEGLNMHCALGNPTGLGIHNKMILIHVDEQGWIHVGSLNGTEQSSKGNREIALQVQSNEAYNYLEAMFRRDWQNLTWLPLLIVDYRTAATYVLISEVLYDSTGADDAEFIEIANPTASPLDLSGWIVADAVYPDDFEDARHFPPGTILEPHTALVVATSASGFYAQYGSWPDFEIIDTEPLVADMIDDPRWGDPEALLQLGNKGDEVLLREPSGTVIDAVAYGNGSYPGVITCPLLTTYGHSLERYPYWRDSNDCSVDFRPWRFPNPGELP